MPLSLNLVMVARACDSFIPGLYGRSQAVSASKMSAMPSCTPALTSARASGRGDSHGHPCVHDDRRHIRAHSQVSGPRQFFEHFDRCNDVVIDRVAFKPGQGSGAYAEIFNLVGSQEISLDAIDITPGARAANSRTRCIASSAIVSPRCWRREGIHDLRQAPPALSSCCVRSRLQLSDQRSCAGPVAGANRAVRHRV